MNPQLRIHDQEANRLVTASPNIFMVWEGDKPVRAIAGPHALPSDLVPRTQDDLWDRYREWVAAGEPA